jgi:hypothetical protein
MLAYPQADVGRKQLRARQLHAGQHGRFEFSSESGAMVHLSASLTVSRSARSSSFNTPNNCAGLCARHISSAATDAINQTTAIPHTTARK